MGAIASIPHARVATPRRLLRLRSDAVLAERFARGDDGAFAVLYERHRASVLAICMGVLGSRHDAEDAAQESFAALAVALRSSPPREMRPWLGRVARNAAIDVARRRPRAPLTTADETVPDPGRDHGEVRAELDSVRAGLQQLPSSQRTALLMRELAGHSYREIAALLETDEEAVRGLIARARVGLREYRAASELPCASARAALAAEPDGRRHDRTVRRHVRGCPSCKAYRRMLREDARALRGILPVGGLAGGGIAGGGIAGGGAVLGGIATKSALLGGALTQVTAACAVSVCAVGGIALLAPHAGPSAVHGSAGAGGSVSAPAAAGGGHARGSESGGDGSVPGARLGGELPAVGSAGGTDAGVARDSRPGPGTSVRVVSAPSAAVGGRFRVPGAGPADRSGGSGAAPSTMDVGAGGTFWPSRRPSDAGGGQVGSIPPAETRTGGGGDRQAAAPPGAGGGSPTGAGSPAGGGSPTEGGSPASPGAGGSPAGGGTSPSGGGPRGTSPGGRGGGGGDRPAPASPRPGERDGSAVGGAAPGGIVSPAGGGGRDRVPAGGSGDTRPRGD